MIISKRTTLIPIIISFLVVATHLAIGANATQRVSKEEYISRYKQIAIEHQQYYGIPASITMAQGILESDSGNSVLAKGSNNHFGIKCKSNWTGRTFTHTDDAPDECFRAYKSVEDSYEDHANFLDSSPRYDSLFRFSPTDYRSWARGLKGAGYATAPDYAERLVKVIQDNKLYLLDAEAEGLSPAQYVPIESGVGAEQGTLVPGIAINPNNFLVTIDQHKGYNIYRTNHTFYIVAKSGDTPASIAEKFELSEKLIRRFNELDKSQKIEAGDVIFIERKQSRWLGNIQQHHILEGETISTLSRKYAIRESSLRKLNRLKSGEEPAVGSDIRLRK